MDSLRIHIIRVSKQLIRAVSVTQSAACQCRLSAKKVKYRRRSYRFFCATPLTSHGTVSSARFKPRRVPVLFSSMSLNWASFSVGFNTPCFAVASGAASWNCHELCLCVKHMTIWDIGNWHYIQELLTRSELRWIRCSHYRRSLQFE